MNRLARSTDSAFESLCAPPSTEYKSFDCGWSSSESIGTATVIANTAASTMMIFIFVDDVDPGKHWKMAIEAKTAFLIKKKHYSVIKMNCLVNFHFSRGSFRDEVSVVGWKCQRQSRKILDFCYLKTPAYPKKMFKLFPELRMDLNYVEHCRRSAAKWTKRVFRRVIYIISGIRIFSTILPSFHSNRASLRL